MGALRTIGLTVAGGAMGVGLGWGLGEATESLIEAQVITGTDEIPRLEEEQREANNAQKTVVAKIGSECVKLVLPIFEDGQEHASAIASILFLDEKASKACGDNQDEATKNIDTFLRALDTSSSADADLGVVRGKADYLKSQGSIPIVISVPTGLIGLFFGALFSKKTESQ